MKLSILTAALMLTATSVMAQDFPLTIEHKFGTTVIETAPERVASVDYAGADDLLALGVQPVAIRHWYGDHPRSVWPWADALLEGTPTILKGDLDYEAIAATNPDVIIGLWSGIDADAYEKLSLIAPVVAVPEGMGDYSMPWYDRALTAGKAVGRSAEAQEQVDAIRAQLAKVGEAHPEWVGKTAAVCFYWADNPGCYTSGDARPQLIAQMGFTTPEAIDALAGEGSFNIKLSQEDLSPLEADLLLWLTTKDNFDNVESLVARPFLEVTKEGRDVFVNAEIVSSFSHSSLLSLPYAIERLVPMIEAALDGDPTTHADARAAQ